MTLRHMRIFAEVYRTRNVTHAAQNLHMTQPAVTRAIQELEQHYGVRLFERLYRHLSPTEAAQRLYAQAVYLLDTFDHMEAAMRDWDSLGVVRVGATVTLGSTILPVLARRFAALYPGIELQAKVANGSVLADALCENQLDLALLENSVSVPDLHTEPIGTDCLCAVLAPAHPLNWPSPSRTGRARWCSHRQSPSWRRDRAVNSKGRPSRMSRTMSPRSAS